MSPRETEGERSQVEAPRLLPWHVPLLGLAVVAGLWLALGVGPALDSARESASWSPELRREFLLALGFNAVLGAGLVGFFLLDLLACTWLLLRGASLGRLLLRGIACAAPGLLLGVAHVLLNPWILDVARLARRWLA